MGNSEVGHLNLGAGAVVRQDLVRIDDAIADGSLAQNEMLRAAFADAGRVHLIGLVSDGGVHSSLEHLRALIALGGERGGEGPGGARVHRRARHAAARRRRRTCASSTARRACAWARWWGATGRWTATGAGSARSARTTCSCTAARRISADSGEQAVRGGLRARRDGRVHRADARRRGGAHQPGRQRDRVQLPPRPDARDHARAGGAGLRRWRRRRGGERRICPAGRAAAARSPWRRYATLTRYEEGWPYPVVFSPGASRDDAVGGAGAGGRRAAARGRDGEVPARDVLLQRRRRGAAGRRAARDGALAARRADLRPQARR